MLGRVSMEYATTSHLCFCGCGNTVVTPLSPTDWQLYFDGRNVSPTPSVGNWDFACRSHYWINNSQVQWALGWTQDQVDRAAALDSEVKGHYFAREGEAAETPSEAPTAEKRTWVSRWHWFGRNHS